MIAAAEAAQAHEFIQAMPDGYETEVGERGVTLSGGQKQRIALARAAYSRAKLYVLDSPLSAVDMYTCQHIFKYCIQGLMSGGTVVLGQVVKTVKDFQVTASPNTPSPRMKFHISKASSRSSRETTACSDV